MNDSGFTADVVTFIVSVQLGKAMLCFHETVFVGILYPYITLFVDLYGIRAVGKPDISYRADIEVRLGVCEVAVAAPVAFQRDGVSHTVYDIARRDGEYIGVFIG